MAEMILRQWYIIMKIKFNRYMQYKPATIDPVIDLKCFLIWF